MTHPQLQRHPDQRFCTECSAVVSRSASFCVRCGAPFRGGIGANATVGSHGVPTLVGTMGGAPVRQADQKFCLRCARVLHVSAMTCPGCGAPQLDLPGMMPFTAARSKERVLAVVLAVLLGAFGAHRFYLGHIGLGLLYLLFFWTFIPAIVAFVEAIVWATMNEGDWQARYGGRSF